MIQREPNREWSGVIFYTISDLSKLMETGVDVEVHDFFPLDIGTAASTSPDFDERILDILDKYPELEEMKMGALHSHNTMAAYFSAIDNDDLANNAGCYRHYLSIVVNNRLNVVARLTFNIRSTTQYMLITDPVDNESPTYDLSSNDKNVDMVGYIDLEVMVPEISSIQDDYSLLCDSLLKPKPVASISVSRFPEHNTTAPSDLFTAPSNPFYTVLECFIRGGVSYNEKMNSDYEKDPTTFLSSYSLSNLRNLMSADNPGNFQTRMRTLYKNFALVCRPYLRYENADYTYINDEFYFLRELSEVALDIATELRGNKFPKYEHVQEASTLLVALSDILDYFEFKDEEPVTCPYNGYLED